MANLRDERFGESDEPDALRYRLEEAERILREAGYAPDENGDWRPVSGEAQQAVFDDCVDRLPQLMADLEAIDVSQLNDEQREALDEAAGRLQAILEHLVRNVRRKADGE